MLTKENTWKTPEELLVDYMDHIPKQEYEEMYAMLHIEVSGNISHEDSTIFPNLTSSDKVRVSTTQAERGEIRDRNVRVLEGKGTAWAGKTGTAERYRKRIHPVRN